MVFNKVTNDFERDYFEKDNIDIVLKLSGIKNSLIIREGERTIPEKELEKFLGIEVK